MTLRRENVLLVGDSIVSRIEAVDLPDIEVMAGHGCKTWDDNNPTWLEKLMTPLSRRLKDTPRVKVLFIHLGANDTAISLDSFETNYRLLLANMRYASEDMVIECSHILPRTPLRRRFNERQDAMVNSHIASMNQVIDRVAAEVGGRAIPHPEFRDMIHELHFWQDAIHPTPAGARILARSLDVRVQLLIKEAKILSTRPILRPLCQGNSTPRSQSRPSASASSSASKRTETPASQPRSDVRSRINASSETRSSPPRGENRNRPSAAATTRRDRPSAAATTRRDRPSAAATTRRDRPSAAQSAATPRRDRPSAAQSAATPRRDRPTPSSASCPIPECRGVPATNQSARHHFFKCHLPGFLRHRDGDGAMPKWAAVFKRILGMTNSQTIFDLHSKVLSEGWFPPNRSAASAGPVCAGDKVMIDSFARYINVAAPMSYAESAPASPAMIIQWRVLRAIMINALARSQRQSLKSMMTPPGGRRPRLN